MQKGKYCDLHPVKDEKPKPCPNFGILAVGKLLPRKRRVSASQVIEGWECKGYGTAGPRCQRMTGTHWLQVTLCVNRNDAGAQQSPQASSDGRGEAPSTSSPAGSSSVPGEAACRTGLLRGLPAGKDETQSSLVIWFCLL